MEWLTLTHHSQHAAHSQVKNMKKYFSFEVQILDDKNVRRRFRASNYQSTTRVKPFICTMPMRLDDGWNQIQFNLADFTRRAYGEADARVASMGTPFQSVQFVMLQEAEFLLHPPTYLS